MMELLKIQSALRNQKLLEGAEEAGEVVVPREEATAITTRPGKPWTFLQLTHRQAQEEEVAEEVEAEQQLEEAEEAKQ